jgi:phospholipid-binding lipoprotein MlaA
MMPLVAAAAIMSVVAGCSSDSSRVANDPYESTNRQSYDSHLVLYRNVIRPVAVFYNHAVPEPARDGVHNFLVNIDLPVTFGNDLLQGRIVASGQTLVRFAVNSTIGVGGLIDVARRINIPEHETGFADTLASYGVDGGPYLYIPVIGPSVPRELAGKIVDVAFDPLTYVTYGASIFVSAGRQGATFVDKRARGVATVDEIEKVSSDPYATTRLLYQKHLAAEADHTAPDADFDDHPENVRLAAREASQGRMVASTSASVAPQDTGAYCASVAQTRADDAAANGYKPDMQQVVHDGVYKDCVSWQTTHASASARTIALQ